MSATYHIIFVVGIPLPKGCDDCYSLKKDIMTGIQILCSQAGLFQIPLTHYPARSVFTRPSILAISFLVQFDHDTI